MERSKNGGLSPARRGKSPPFGHRTAVDNAAMQASLCPWHGAVIWRKPASTAAAWPAEHCNERRDRVCTRQFHAHVLRSGLAGLRHRSLAHASTAYVCGRPGSAVLLFLLFSIAFANLYNFVLHVFFGKVAAAFIGWEDSPFQLEVGFASLGFAALGLLAFKGSLDLRLAAIVGPACFLWGAAGGHVFQMMSAQFCPRQCWRHFLQRCLGSDLGLHISGYSAVPPGHIGRDEGKKIHARTVASAGV
jgi:hypothetical protein